MEGQSATKEEQQTKDKTLFCQEKWSKWTQIQMVRKREGSQQKAPMIY